MNKKKKNHMFPPFAFILVMYFMNYQNIALSMKMNGLYLIR